MSEQVKTRKKLIEVTLPLDKINEASAREKSIRHGHPSTLHLWWARRPLAAARAVIFSQMVDDPSEYVDELLAVAENRGRAERELELRRAEWDKLKALHERALQDGNALAAPPGAEATLRGCAADLERERLFSIIKDLVLWESTTNETALAAARVEIANSWRRTCADNRDHPNAVNLFNPDKLPSFHDPFAGGGALPLEAQRLGLKVNATDLNPVAVLINKAMIEIPPKFEGRPPVNPDSREQREMRHMRWRGAEGLAEDLRYYGNWMRAEAEKRIGHLYPKVEITPEMTKERPDLTPLIGRTLTVIAWLWARTVKSPNPAFTHVDVPLATTFLLSKKPGKEAYVKPRVEGGSYRFEVKVGKPLDEDVDSGTKLSRGANFRCLMSGTPITGDYIKAEGKAGRMAARLMAIVAEGDRERVYLSPTEEMEITARAATPVWKPETPLAFDPRALWTPPYGLESFGDLFAPRQLVALNTFSELIAAASERIRSDAISAGVSDDGNSLDSGGTGATAYATAVSVQLAFAVDKAADYWSTICFWHNGAAHQKIVNTFSRQAIPMSWDYAEANPFSTSSGHFLRFISLIGEVFDVSLPARPAGTASQQDAARASAFASPVLISTDPPYFDNIGYADLSDYFYVWLRRSLRSDFPDLFSTVAVPRSEELVATPYRHGGKERAEAFFIAGMTEAMQRMVEETHPSFPVTIYYAFKQAETDSTEGTASTGWEVFIDAIIRAGFAISGTWPVRTEYTGNLKKNVSALASSIVLVCRQRVANAPIATRGELISALKSDLPRAVAHLQRGNIAPVDLAQAAIGPGMAVYTRYSKVVDAQGKPLSIRDVLSLVNQILDEVLAEQEGDFDADTRWALAWFEHAGFEAGEYGMAETLSKAKNTSVQGMKDAGILDKKTPGGKVRLLRPSELPTEWDPVRDPRLTVWEAVHQLVRRLESNGESACAELVSVLGGVAEVARELAYRLYTISERKKRPQEALSYNALVQSWPEISRLVRENRGPHAAQVQMFQ